MGKPSAIKRAVKLLAVCKDPEVRSKILSRAPDQLVKTICNAVLNLERGDIALSKAQKKSFAKHRAQIAKLTSPSFSVPTKRKILLQKGGFFPLIPLLLSTVLPSIGSALFNRFTK